MRRMRTFSEDESAGRRESKQRKKEKRINLARERRESEIYELKEDAVETPKNLSNMDKFDLLVKRRREKGHEEFQKLFEECNECEYVTRTPRDIIINTNCSKCNCSMEFAPHLRQQNQCFECNEYICTQCFATCKCGATKWDGIQWRLCLDCRDKKKSMTVCPLHGCLFLQSVNPDLEEENKGKSRILLEQISIQKYCRPCVGETCLFCGRQPNGLCSKEMLQLIVENAESSNSEKLSRFFELTAAKKIALGKLRLEN